MLKQRILTALVLIPIALWGLFGLSGGAFALFTGAIVVLAAWEWANLAGHVSFRSQVVWALVFAAIMLSLWLTGLAHSVWLLGLAAPGWLLNLYWVLSYPERQLQWSGRWRRMLMSAWVLLPCWTGFLLLRQSGAEWLLYVLLLVWTADTGAYFAGRAFGRRKLAPQVSPGKSWEGVWGGMLATVVLAVAFAVWQKLGLAASLLLIVITLVIALISVLGDLFESMLKRVRGIKDSSALLPGHGGVLDRIDSLTAAVPMFALLRLLL
ncbi:phosphatidate cytidylyltransferase [Pistricoccus aurantiacus]|uniref:phosphatidate cytidylyltransferase n=1 Tax=Pistricoccus aurantiacus TaxID=1883414 RepID=UPI00363E9894